MEWALKRITNNIKNHINANCIYAKEESDDKKNGFSWESFLSI